MDTQAWGIGVTLTCLTSGNLKFSTLIDPGNIKLFTDIVIVECEITTCLRFENCIFWGVDGNNNDTLELGF
jgi:hypothetical protein